jgi:delta1-piperideine-2-carboxylate reductase
LTAGTDVHLAYNDLVTLVQRIFVKNGVSEHNASILSENCAGCERDGSLSHGVFRIPGYVSSLNSGWVDGQAVPEVEDCRTGFRTRQCQGRLYPTGFLCRSAAVHRKGKAERRRGSSHSSLASFQRALAGRRAVCRRRPGGAHRRQQHGLRRAAWRQEGSVRHQSDRLRLAARRRAPFVFDQASSAIAHGDVQIAARAGHELKPGMGVDRDGQPTTDPKAILDGGALLPFGGHKGNSIALMVEILSAALTGGYFSGEFDWSGHKGAQTPFTGQFFVVIDPERGGNNVFAHRVAEICDLVLEAGQDRLPGDRRHLTRAKAAREGIPLSAKNHEMLRSMAEA